LLVSSLRARSFGKTFLSVKAAALACVHDFRGTRLFGAELPSIEQTIHLCPAGLHYSARARFGDPLARLHARSDRGLNRRSGDLLPKPRLVQPSF
jgi:hypothetical protein